MSVRALKADPALVAADGGSLVRRRAVVVVTLIVGATLLHLAFAQPAGSTSFYAYTFALAVAGATGGLLSGPLPFVAVGRARVIVLREAVGAVALGVLIAGIFIAGASVVALIHPLRRFVVDVVTHTHGTSFALILAVTIINAVAEEVFFRGAVYAAIGPAVSPRNTIALTTLIYIATIAISGNLALAFAAAVLGLALAIERRFSGDLLAPALTHATWSAVMLIVLPLIF